MIKIITIHYPKTIVLLIWARYQSYGFGGSDGDGICRDG